MAGKMYDTGLTSGAFGEAPFGPAPEGQAAGEMYPGNPRMMIDRSNPNPSQRDLRIEALYDTIEAKDHMKRDAGARMERAINGRARMATNNWGY